jgi:ATP-dependent helicase/nuclease subunit A
MEFTSAQKKVIETHNRNILVSAAAGSGKTAVLVERIIQMITRQASPIEIDSLLVVTFTNAAAAEMRERIGDALERAIEAEPENLRLQNQLTLLPTSNIMTIHAFCLRLIKQHFHMLDLDPTFRIGDEGELKLLQQEALEEVLEAAYTKRDETFIDFIERFSTGKTDKNIEAILLQAYRMSQSHPWPKEWLTTSVNKLDFHSNEAFYQSEYAHFLKEVILERLEFACVLFDRAIEIVDEDECLKGYQLSALSYKAQAVEAIQLLNNEGYQVFVEQLMGGIKFERIKNAHKDADPEQKEMAKKLIDDGKAQILDAIKSYASPLDKDFIVQQAQMKTSLITFNKLIFDFMELYDTNKRKKQLIDFNDVEHFALKLLIDPETHEPTAIASVYQKQFDEILMDEYQDSNQVQESLMVAVSRESISKPNRFMVGDIKQSIYKFRLAQPELFMEKYESYSLDDSLYQLIHLGQNFRSRGHILDFANMIFGQVMSKRVGDVIYNTDAALHQGANYYSQANDAYTTELLLTETKEVPELNHKEIEALICGVRIEELMLEEPRIQVFDKSLQGQRNLEYGDIAILLRTMSQWSEVFAEVLLAMGIPVKTDVKTGYFEALEIQILLNVLKVIDNPRQDIALLSVLRSPIVGLRGQELLKIRLSLPDVSMYEAFVAYIERPFDIEMTQLERKAYEQAVKFMKSLEAWRISRFHLSIHELLKQVLDDTQFVYYVTLMQEGEKKRANIEMLLERAYQYEQTSLQGLYQFLNYIEKIQKQSIDFGATPVFNPEENDVQILSIHKSKGLEFPVVILPSLEKGYNARDLSEPILYHQDLGIATDFIEPQKRYRLPLPPRTVIKEKLNQEMRSEELRILYVALTRAREKLILIGAVPKIEAKMKMWQLGRMVDTKMLPSVLVADCKNYLDVIMLALSRHPIWYALGGSLEGMSYQMEKDVPIVLRLFDPVDLKSISQRNERSTFEERAIDKTQRFDEIDHILRFSYPYQAQTQMPISQSVSEIKRRQELLDFEERANNNLFDDKRKQINLTRPVFMEEQKPLSSAQIGTAYHRVFCHLNLFEQAEDDAIQNYIDNLVAQKMLTKQEASALDTNVFVEFLKSQMADRMRLAQKKGLLEREKSFIMGVAHKEIVSGSLIEDSVMVQGVVDAFFIEDDSIVLVDYKTDEVKIENIHVLVKRYQLQIELYKKAIEKAYQKPIKEAYLYVVKHHQFLKMIID